MASTMNRRIFWPLLLLASSLVMSGSAAAGDSDRVVLDNGNAITGEIKSLLQGQLKLKTDHAGTIYIEWEFVDYLTSPAFFEVETETGEFIYGSLGAGAEKRRLLVSGEEETVVLDMVTVVEIMPLERTFWDRVDGSVDLGLSYTGADRTLQYSLESNAAYRTQKYSASITLNSIETRTDGEEDVLRNTFEMGYTRYHGRRFFGAGAINLTRNTELGVDLRTELSYEFGRSLIMTNRSNFTAGIGGTWSREHPTGPGSSTNQGWGSLSVRYHYFLYNFPETNVLLDLSMQPGISEWPRTRATLTASLRREFAKDFTLSLSAYDNFDSDPLAGANSEHDFVVVTSLGWTF
jgi:hypothetical protein